jgi:hypothetical protein
MTTAKLRMIDERRVRVIIVDADTLPVTTGLDVLHARGTRHPRAVYT